MKKIYPLYLSPCVGYCMYHLSHGRTPGDMADQLAGHQVYGRLKPEYRARAIKRAIANLVATAKLVTRKPGMTFGDLFK